MIDSKQLRKHIIQPVLKAIGKYSHNAEELLLLTVAQESGLGKYLHQLNGGPAKGIYQMEPTTHDDIWNNYLAYRKDLSDKVLGFGIEGGYSSLYDFDKARAEADQMCGNLYYATAMARCHYLRVSESLPEHADVEGMAMYYKKHYNTHKGKATVEEAISNYNKYVKGKENRITNEQ